jgi:hypothetical protein
MALPSARTDGATAAGERRLKAAMKNFTIIIEIHEKTITWLGIQPMLKN